ncbi:MAG: hypothetical protein K9M36_02670 [Candidatus Pacebacteria bacterium]|nr:hypothetical protein [Candidatus Paceibacterota bacterium]
MNFERRGPSAFDENNFPLPGNDLASAHVGPEEVVLVEDDLKRVKKEEKTSLYDEDEVGAPDVVRRNEERYHMRGDRSFGYIQESKRIVSMLAKNAKRKERPKGSADLPFDVN